MVRFFTLPPQLVPYPYILINANRPERGLWYISRYRDVIRAVIIDSGVEIFRDGKVREYPGGPEAWIARVVHIYDSVRRVARGAAVYATCPDYPDDYAPRSLWLSDAETNIERTILNVLRCVDWYSDVRWLLSIQGWYRRPSSVIISLEYMEQLGVLSRYRYLAVANLCVESSIRIVRDSVLYAYSWLKSRGYDHALHVFGLKLSSIDSVRNYIHSFDSLAWTRPVSSRLYRVFNWSAKNEKERVLFFCEYVLRLAGHGVDVDLEVFRHCYELLSAVAMGLQALYPMKSNAIAYLVSEIRSELERFLEKAT